MNNGVSEYWWRNIVDIVSSVFYNVFGGCKGMKCGVIILLYSEIIIFLYEYARYFEVCGHLRFIETIEGVHIFHNFMTVMDD